MPVAVKLVTAAQMFKRNEAMLAKAIDGLSGEQWQVRPGGSGNSALWIVGHIAWARSRSLKLLGVDWSAPWMNQFERGSRDEAGLQRPSHVEIVAAFKDLSQRLSSALEAASDAALSAPAPEPSPSLDGTIGGMVSFLALHEAYHIGQIAYLRSLVGLEKGTETKDRKANQA